MEESMSIFWPHSLKTDDKNLSGFHTAAPAFLTSPGEAKRLVQWTCFGNAQILRQSLTRAIKTFAQAPIVLFTNSPLERAVVLDPLVSFADAFR
ncbi:MAG: hypothetical protein LBJ64_06315 [Deltaproteobacteria bacterium]|nr:hypothetical protein [Deltaproteobacteria bacterium]